MPVRFPTDNDTVIIFREVIPNHNHAIHATIPHPAVITGAGIPHDDGVFRAIRSICSVLFLKEDAEVLPVAAEVPCDIQRLALRTASP